MKPLALVLLLLTGNDLGLPRIWWTSAVRIGDLKVVRQGLKTKTPGAWEVYDVAKDQAEAHDLAAFRADVIQRAEQIVRCEVTDNIHFPLAIPGVNSATD